MDMAKFGEPTWPDLVSGLQGKIRLGSRFQGLDGLGSFGELSKLRDYQILKENCKNWKNLNFEVKNQIEMRKINR